MRHSIVVASFAAVALAAQKEAGEQEESLFVAL